MPINLIPTRRSLLIGMGAFLIGLVISVLALRENTIPLTRETLEQAKTLWNQNAVRNYDIKYKMNDGLYEVTCANGIVTELRVDGRIPDFAEYGMYSVDGLFKTLAMDLDLASDPYGPLGGITMRVRFHPQYGYVEYYVRSSGSVGRGASIQMEQFQPDSPSS